MHRWMIALAMVALLAAPAVAADLDGTLRKIKSTNTITLGYREASRPFSFAGDDGKDLGVGNERRPGEHLALPAQRLFEQRGALREVILVCYRRYFRRVHQNPPAIVPLILPG